jgi:hypothetical protein
MAGKLIRQRETPQTYNELSFEEHLIPLIDDELLNGYYIRTGKMSYSRAHRFWKKPESQRAGCTGLSPGTQHPVLAFREVAGSSGSGAGGCSWLKHLKQLQKTQMLILDDLVLEHAYAVFASVNTLK